MYDFFVSVQSNGLVFINNKTQQRSVVNNPTSLLNKLRGGKTFVCSSSVDFPEEYTDSVDVLHLVKSLRQIASGENNFEVL